MEEGKGEAADGMSQVKQQPSPTPVKAPEVEQQGGQVHTPKDLAAVAAEAVEQQMMKSPSVSVTEDLMPTGLSPLMEQ
eukprot:5951045-Karenia_brevis.AAC.1